MRAYQFLVCGAVLGACSLSLVQATARAAERDSSTNKSNGTASEAEALVKKALQAEADDDLKSRDEYLAQAVAADPDYAPAHWQMGEVLIDGKWRAVDSAAAISSMSAKFREYQQRRSRVRPQADDLIKLANWCEQAGLAEQAKLHWQAALQLPTTHAQRRELAGKLDLVRFRKQWMPAATAEKIKQNDKQVDKMMREWKPVLTRWRNDLESRDTVRQAAAAEKLRELRDIAVIPVIETVFSHAPAASGRAAIAGIAAMPEVKASESLVRFAVQAENEQVRQAAAEALKSRDVFSYVPMLLAGLSNPIEISFQTFVTPGGMFGERLTLYREGPEYNMSVTSGVTALPNFAPRPGAVAIPQTAQAEAQVAAQAANDQLTAQAALEENERSAIANERIIAALRVSTGNDSLGDAANDWWDWWQKYNELHFSGDPQTYEVNRSAYTYYGAKFVELSQPWHSTQSTYQAPASKPSYPAPQYSAPTTGLRYLGLPKNLHYDSGVIACFVPGTIVWTVTGKVPIEDVNVGDLVLAQDVETGELAYKPVLRTTKGPPLPLVEIRTGAETIRCTHGHLFWVSGTGWQMAKELKVGDRLHTTKGTMLVDAVEKKGEASCHNLIVPDFNTYFVTNEQILVHDIDVRGPTTATVPGLTAQ